jgi:hypothetical protein
VYSPALVGWVGGPQVNINIHIGDRPAPVVGWVPLGPRDIYRPGYVVTPGYHDRVNPWPHRDGHYDPRHPQPVPTGPIMLSNRNVPGALNVAALSAMALRQPVRPVTAPLNDDAMRRLMNERNYHEPPPPPTTRVVPQPGGAVPVRPQPPQPVMRPTLPAPGTAPSAQQPVPSWRDRGRSGQEGPSQTAPGRPQSPMAPAAPAQRAAPSGPAPTVQPGQPPASAGLPPRRPDQRAPEAHPL